MWGGDGGGMRGVHVVGCLRGGCVEKEKRGEGGGGAGSGNQDVERNILSQGPS